MNVLSLFDGISCGMIALERAGIKVDNYYSSEIEESAINVSNRNYPDIIRVGDIKNIDQKMLVSMPRIDLILAGSPCQGFSRNGSMLNFEHSQSKLFFEFTRILNWIKENNNKNVKFLLENVEMKKEWENIITEELNVNPIKINSRLTSAQNRPRVYWSNIDNITEPIDKNISLVDILEETDTSELLKYKGILVDKSFNENELNLIDVAQGEVRISQATKLGHIIAEDGDGVNLSFPTSKTRRGRVIKNKSGTLDKQCNICVYHDNAIRKLSVTELERLQTLPDGYTECVSDNKRKQAIGNGWTVDVISHILKGIK